MNHEPLPAQGPVDVNVRRTIGRSALSAEDRMAFDSTGCGEGYEWWLRHQGLLASKSALDGERDYPPTGKWYQHIDEYHAWMDA